MAPTKDTDNDDSSSVMDDNSSSVMDDNSHQTDPSTFLSTRSSVISSTGSDFSDLLGEDKLTDRALWFRLLLLALLLGVGVAATVLVYLNTAEAEQVDFEEKLDAEAEKIFLAIGTTLDLRMSSADAYMYRQVSHALSVGSELPYALSPDFCIQTSKLLSFSKAFSLENYFLITAEERPKWENYTANNHWWVDDCIDVQERNPNFKGPILRDYNVSDVLYTNVDYHPDNATGPFLPNFASYPVVPYWAPYNWDANAYDEFSIPMHTSMDTLTTILTPVVNYAPVHDADLVSAADGFNSWASSFIDPEDDPTEPMSSLLYPIHSAIQDVVANTTNHEGIKRYGVMGFSFYWWHVLEDVLVEDESSGVYVVFKNPCGDQVFSYRVSGRLPVFVGYQDVDYNDMCQTRPLFELSNLGGDYTGLPINGDFCPYTITICPTEAMEEHYLTSGPTAYAIAVALVFLFFVTTVVFLMYGLEVTRRQKLTLAKALQARSIVNDVFPAAIRDRLFEQKEKENAAGYISSKHRMKSFLNDDALSSRTFDPTEFSEPIADLYTDTTILFADIAGFTPWSSQRDPGQVFSLLQAVFQAFDCIAHRRKVFKVETVGDSYVAACGVPYANPKHAIVMAYFAQECLFAFNRMTKKLEVRLGPDTGDLQLRVGLHSGPCTAGVLQGDRARFQLFGNTVNMASRMESHGTANKIHVSKATAGLLAEAGMGSWITPNTEAVHVKGKGFQDTYWLVPHSKYAVSSATSETLSPGSLDNPHHRVTNKKSSASKTKKIQRLIEWNVQTLSNLLKPVVARRQAVLKVQGGSDTRNGNLRLADNPLASMPLDEVQDILKLPKFDEKAASVEVDPATVVLEANVLGQLRDFITDVSKMYHDNPFHNFEHASHVASSVEKLLKRIVAPDIDAIAAATSAAQGLHDYSYGITSDPLTQFAVVFSALIHDADHRGVSNKQLATEQPNLDDHYQGKSLAEQNSVDLAWELLMKDEFQDLRFCIWGNSLEDMKRFRKIVVSVVLATDIFDKELNDLRKGRWSKAFSGDLEVHADLKDFKATIVIEHLIQASDVSHTMQHWKIYRKWNERLFIELYHAFKAGRAGADPSTFWAKGEIGFFDNYIIPLAKKLKECNVFGVSSDEYLNYAMENREEWAQKGETIVQELVTKYCSCKEPSESFEDILEDVQNEEDSTYDIDC